MAAASAVKNAVKNIDKEDIRRAGQYVNQHREEIGDLVDEYQDISQKVSQDQKEAEQLESDAKQLEDKAGKEV